MLIFPWWQLDATARIIYVFHSGGSMLGGSKSVLSVCCSATNHLRLHIMSEHSRCTFIWRPRAVDCLHEMFMVPLFCHSSTEQKKTAGCTWFFASPATSALWMRLTKYMSIGVALGSISTVKMWYRFRTYVVKKVTSLSFSEFPGNWATSFAPW